MPIIASRAASSARGYGQFGKIVKLFEYLVVAGGGGGGNGNGTGYEAGGAGAGGLLTGTQEFDDNITYTITVGAGGGAATNGSNSVFNTLTAIGGGYGASGGTNAGSGGSGGGGAHANTLNGTGTAGQGFAGERPDSNSCGGGGGGAGEAGATDGRGSGGDGIESSITGTPTYYAGGGAAWSAARGILGTPGLGGGGSSTSTLNGTSTSGTANTGGGGGGAYHTGGGGTNGGSGVVILSYPNNFNNLVLSGGLNYSLNTTNRPGYKVYTFTSGTGTVKYSSTGPSNIQEALSTYSGRAGLIGQYFNGDWRSTISTGNIGTLPLSSPTTYSSIAYGSRGDNYGFIAIGYFLAPTTGTYTFYTSSDDGSGVWIGDIAAASSGRTTANAVLNNNLGGGQGDTKRSGTISLTGGTWYPIRIVHEEGGGGDNLTFSWAGPGIGETTSLSTYFKAPMDLSGNNLNTYYA
jgi:hypothetical protein